MNPEMKNVQNIVDVSNRMTIASALATYTLLEMRRYEMAILQSDD